MSGDHISAMLGRMKRGLCVSMAVALVWSAGACGTDVVFGPATGGTGGSAGDGGNGATGNQGGAGNQGGGQVGCSDDVECEVDSPCVDGFCSDDGTCDTTPLPQGTPCGADHQCDGMGDCLGIDGAACVDDGECLSGFCTDGVCCAESCDGTCETCNASGSAGVCVPHDTGTDPDDECGAGSCTSAGDCATGAHLWSASHGAASSQFARDVATDAANNAVVFGYFFNSINLGGNTLDSAGNRDLFLVKFDASGNHVWSQRFGDANDQYGWEVEVDPQNGHIIVAGYFDGVLAFDNTAPLIGQGNQDLFVARFDASGTHLWSKAFSAPGFSELWSLDVAPNGRIVIGGYFTGSLDFGGDTLSTAAFNDIDGFVAVLDADGNHQWSAGYGDGQDQRVYGTAFDASGNVVVAGRHFGTITFGSTVLTATAERDIFVAKLDASGTALWASQFGGDGVQLAWDVAVAPGGDIALVGYNTGTVDFGGGDLVSGGGSDLVVAALDASGAHLWSHNLGGPGEQPVNGASIATDAAGNVLLTGDIASSIDFGGGPLASAGQADAFVAKYDPSGVHLWSYVYGSSDMDIGRGITADSQLSVYLVGQHAGGIDFGGGPLMNAGAYDAYVVKLAP